MKETVVLVHGVWMTGIELGVLAWRLRRRGYRTVCFRYRSLYRPVDFNARRLRECVDRLGNTRVHLVAHSLGGIVCLQALQDRPQLVSGRIVLLGSPVNGSVVAQRIWRYPLFRWLLGRSAAHALLGDGPRWQGGQPLGVIAGTRPVGVGLLLGGFDGDNDGTVAVSETRLETATASTTFYSSHFGMVVSRAVAKAVSRFLGDGRFGTTGEQAG